MGIDWVHVIAMLVNFLSMVYLLRRFLYGPVLKVMDEREQNYAAGREAAAKARRAEEEAAAYREKMASLQARDRNCWKKRGRPPRRSGAASPPPHAWRSIKCAGAGRRRWTGKKSLCPGTAPPGGRAGLFDRPPLPAGSGRRPPGRDGLACFLMKVEGLPAEERSKIKAALSAEGAKLQVRSAFGLDQAKLEQLQAALRRCFRLTLALITGQTRAWSAAWSWKRAGTGWPGAWTAILRMWSSIFCSPWSQRSSWVVTLMRS